MLVKAGWPSLVWCLNQAYAASCNNILVYSPCASNIPAICRVTFVIHTTPPPPNIAVPQYTSNPHHNHNAVNTYPLLQIIKSYSHHLYIPKTCGAAAALDRNYFYHFCSQICSTKLSFTQKSIKQAGITVAFQTSIGQVLGANFGTDNFEFPTVSPRSCRHIPQMGLNYSMTTSFPIL